MSSMLGHFPIGMQLSSDSQFGNANRFLFSESLRRYGQQKRLMPQILSPNTLLDACLPSVDLIMYFNGRHLSLLRQRSSGRQCCTGQKMEILRPENLSWGSLAQCRLINFCTLSFVGLRCNGHLCSGVQTSLCFGTAGRFWNKYMVFRLWYTRNIPDFGQQYKWLPHFFFRNISCLNLFKSSDSRVTFNAGQWLRLLHSSSGWQFDNADRDQN